ncbi:MAG: TlpA family protein disulfide reductase [Longimicrobiaceae bacterium]
MASRDERVNPGRRLPDLALPSASGGVHRLRGGGRRSPVLVHASPCAACDAFVARLGHAAAALREWDGEVMVVAPADGGGEPARDPGFPLLRDPEARVASALGVRAPAVVIADQWGEVHEAREAGEEHRFPTEAEIEQSLRYLAIQCPECQGEAL